MSTTDQMGEFISLQEASEMTARYRATIQPGETIAVAGSREIFDQILAQSGCEGLRMYFAIEPDGTKTLVVVGIDSAENDMTKGLIAENFGPCPKRCPQPNALNS
ncbi:MAG: hypothetical protein NTY55_11350 [Flavobacteriia bacterium]|mgnify:FL=1|jgi:hypothetical protein|nr:hypothetical protein [Flavobacteriia bacterium]